MALNRRYFIVLCCAALVALALAPVARAQATAPQGLDPAVIDAFLRQQVAANHIPGLAIAIVQDGQIVMLRGYGEAGPGRPMTPQTQLYLGSTSKSFTALAVMQLVEEGRLELDAPVQRYLPEFQVADAAASAQITVRQLLNHTSGLSEQGDPNKSAITPSLADQVRIMQDAHLTAPVGTRFQYYSQNYRALGLLIERMSGQSYGDYLRDHIFAPLGMASTVTDPAAAGNLAQGYGQVLGRPLARPQPFNPGGVPSGYIISTAEDLARYLTSMLDNTRAGDRQLVGSETLAQMFTVPPGIGGDYGMGWMVMQDPALGKFFFHGGALDNFQTSLLLAPGQKVGLALLCNQGGVLPMFTGYSTLRDGLLDLLKGNTPQQSSPVWVFPALGAVMALDLGTGVFRTWRLPLWAHRTARRRPAVRWLRALADLLVAPAIVIGVPLVATAIGGGGTWLDAYGLLPDVTAWVLLGSALTLVRGLAKVTIVARQMGLPAAGAHTTRAA
jgi:CubicO group peptidase (beta-lactamase class C family)